MFGLGATFGGKADKRMLPERAAAGKAPRAEGESKEVGCAAAGRGLRDPLGFERTASTFPNLLSCL